MFFTDLKQHLRSGELKAGYYIVGEDAFLRKSAEDMFKNLIRELPELNLSVLTAPDSAQAILEACECLPVMSDRRVVTVYGYKGDFAPIVAYMKLPCPSTVLVFVCESLTQNMSKAASVLTVVECDRLDENTLSKWIAAHVAAAGANITQDACRTLIAYCSRDLTRISGECDKLIAYRAGGVISAEDVRLHVNADTEYKIYELSDAVAKGQRKRAAEALNSLLLSGTQVTALMGMLYSHFRRLLYCAITPSYSQMAAEFGVKEFALKMAKEQAARFTPLRLKKICDSFHKADADFKSGKIADKTALETVIFTGFTA